MCGNPPTTSVATFPVMPPPLYCALCRPYAPNVATTCINGVPLCQWCARPIALKRFGLTDTTKED